MAEQVGDPPAYDAIADWYADYVTGAAAAFTARAGEALRRVLGRGHGVYADGIRQLGWISIGTDISIAQPRPLTGGVHDGLRHAGWAGR